MDDLVSRLARELPDTDRNRYDIAFARGRAQARSALVFGGMAVGAAAGSLAMFLFDPVEGRSRRAELGQRLASLGNDLRRTAEGRATDLRNRTMGTATELGLPGTPASNETRRQDAEELAALGATRRLTSPPAGSAGAARDTSESETNEATAGIPVPKR